MNCNHNEQEAFEYFNSEQHQAGMINRLVLRKENDGYAFYREDSTEPSRVMTVHEMIEEANHYARAMWRRANFKMITHKPLLLQCKVCGVQFSNFTQHEAPCIVR